MRTLANYSLEAVAPINGAGELAAKTRESAHAWLDAKGTRQIVDDREILRLHDGRIAALSFNETSTAKGAMCEIAVIEPTSGGNFRTSVAIANDTQTVSVSCELAAGTDALAPLWLDVRCPHLIRTILSADGTHWTYRGNQLHSAPRVFSAPQGGDDFSNLVWEPGRSVPVVAISEDDGLLLHPGIVEDIATDLAGLAVVAHLDGPATWRVTNRKGKEWSCYSGAIRIYWPNVQNAKSPADHPLWTAQRLLLNVENTQDAAARIRNQIRRRILGQSAFGIAPPALFATIRQAARDEHLAGLHTRIKEGESDAEEYYNEIVRLNQEADAREEEIKRLRGQVFRLQTNLRWHDGSPEEIEPAEQAPPTSVEDAVLQAMERFGDLLVFGEDVNHGMTTVNPDAGPPEKIFNYLKCLAEMTGARRWGPLGTAMVLWLTQRGINASGESPTVRNSNAEMTARTWEDGAGARREFEFHLKPAEGTSPDRCVRIYFDYDEARRSTVIGWVGRHP